MSTSAAARVIDFVKMNGLGNEIVVVDLRASPIVLTGAEAAAIASRPESRFDQLMAIHAPATAGTDGRVRIYNSDGSPAGACGNGMRCVGLLLTGAQGGTLRLETDAGVLEVIVTGHDRISVDMGRPRFGWRDIPLADPFHDTRRIELQVGPADQPILHSPSVVNVGNPHAVFWVDDPDAIDLGRIGPMLENHPLFPDRANISLARIVSRASIVARTWERGAGLTKACGSAACAVAVAAARLGRTERTVQVALPGGTLTIEWRADDHIWMTGPAEFEHRGRIDLANLSG